MCYQHLVSAVLQAWMSSNRKFCGGVTVMRSLRGAWQPWPNHACGLWTCLPIRHHHHCRRPHLRPHHATSSSEQDSSENMPLSALLGSQGPSISACSELHKRHRASQPVGDPQARAPLAPPSQAIKSCESWYSYARWLGFKAKPLCKQAFTCTALRRRRGSFVGSCQTCRCCDRRDVMRKMLRCKCARNRRSRSHP